MFTGMPISIDHVAIPSTNPERSARFLGGLLDTTPEVDGPDGEFRSLRVEGSTLLFVPADGPVAPLHLALRASPEEFEKIVERLRRRDIPYGNDPEDVGNGLSEDLLGGGGRIYFQEEDGHLVEVCC